MTKLFITNEKMEEIRNDDKAIAKEIKRELKKHFPEVKFSASNKAVYGMYIKFDGNLIELDAVKNIIGYFSPLTTATIWVNSSMCYYSDTEQYKEDKEKEYQQQMQEREAKRIENENLYNANAVVEGIFNAKVTEVTGDIFVKALEPSLNKNSWKINNDKYIDEKSYVNKYKITKIVELNKDEYNYFCFNMLEDFDFLAQCGGCEYNEETQKVVHHYGIAIVCEGKETIIVDPSGYSYARYACRLIEDIDGQLESLTQNVNVEIEVYNNRTNEIVDAELYIVNDDAGHVKRNRIDTLLNDKRYVLYDYYGSVILTTGKAYKELLNECGASIEPIQNIHIKEPAPYIEGLIKYDMGLIGTLGMKDDPRIKAIKWADRLQDLLKIANSDIETLKATSPKVEECQPPQKIETYLTADNVEHHKKTRNIDL